MTTSDESVKLRSIYVGDCPDNLLHTASVVDVETNGGNNLPNHDDNKDVKEDLDESVHEPITLPESTHTLFFTQPICSLSVGYATGIVILSSLCLFMALFDNLYSDSSPDNPLAIPEGVNRSVRGAQYLAIFITLIMEEEIPTGIVLLRTITQDSFHAKFPNRSYKKFVAAALLRIFLGYAFLVNVYIILAQATGVLEIFYDVLALQFIQQLDDIGFNIAKMGIVGRRLRHACTARLFHTEFAKQKFQRNKKCSIFLKCVYVLNFVVFLSGMMFVSIRQKNGYYQCPTLDVDWGDGVWEDPIIVINGTVYTDYFLVFAYFNGVYQQVGTYNERPLYREQRKFDNKEMVPRQNLYHGIPVIPSEIKYSTDIGAWIFTHPYIKKSIDEDPDSESWLLRSPPTEDFDLLSSTAEDWSIWLGRIDTTRVTIACNLCIDDTDCNLNGFCQPDGSCICKENVGGVSYIGSHCEIKLREDCGTIKSEKGNVTYSIQKYSSDGSGGEPDTLFQEYNRPVYTHIKNFPNSKEGDVYWLVYTGRRWFGIVFNIIELNVTEQDVLIGTQNFHGK